jgi:hypothetical protein
MVEERENVQTAAQRLRRILETTGYGRRRDVRDNRC